MTSCKRPIKLFFNFFCNDEKFPPFDVYSLRYKRKTPEPSGKTVQAQSDIITELVRILELKKNRGEKRIWVKPENSKKLFAKPAPAKKQTTRATSGAARRPAPAQKQPPTRTPAPTPTFNQPQQPTSAAPQQQHILPQIPPEVAQLDWQTLFDTVMSCRKCPLCQRRLQAVFGTGNLNADLMFIGEGPRADEDRQGTPSVGRAGHLLTKMIAAMQFTREEVYITNIVKCRPPGNRNPNPNESAECLPYLLRQIELVKPKVIVLLGSVPLQLLLGKTDINRAHGVWHELMGARVMPTFHPSYLLRSPLKKREAWEDLQKVMHVLGKQPSQ